jgi:1-acyl-sn-glycerol-3-phosphate acyltransferase
MLKVLRIMILVLLLVVWFVSGMAICLVRPRHKNNVYYLSRMLNWACWVLGVKVKRIIPDECRNIGSAVYVANHQTNYDIMVLGCVMPGTVSMGKQSLAWIPLFGQVYYLSGNILIDRARSSKAADTIRQVVAKIKERGISIWMFPEGTRSKGRGLIPFKTGAFHTAIAAKVPIVPIVCSSYAGQIDLNRWDNGEVIVEMQLPIDSQQWTRATVKDCSNTIRALMESKLAELDAQVKKPQ